MSSQATRPIARASHSGVTCDLSAVSEALDLPRRKGSPLMIADQRGAPWVVPSIGHVGGASWARRRPYDGPREQLADSLELDWGTRAALVHDLYGDDEMSAPCG